MNDNRVQILQKQRQRNTELPARNVGLVERHSRNMWVTLPLKGGTELCVKVV